MRKIMKRGFCLFLVAVLLAGLVPYAFADETEPTETAEASEAATESTEETAETTEPEKDEITDGQLLPDSISTYASTISNVLLFDQASPNYTTVLKSQISVTYQPNGTDAAKTDYIKNLGWHFARYNNTPYEDDPIYCIEPCKNYAASTSGNYMDQDLGVSGSGSSRGSNVWYAMPSSYRQAIALTLLYSKQLWNSNYSVKTTAMANNPNVSTRIATQFLIYEIVTGLRDADTFNRKSSNGYTSGDVFYNAGMANVSGFADKYNSIVSSVQSATKIPSFTSRSSSSAPTITMSGSQVSVTDSNGVLGNFSFSSGNGASFSKSGNTLTITKTGTISPSTVFSATRSLPSAENSTVSMGVQRSDCRVFCDYDLFLVGSSLRNRRQTGLQVGNILRHLSGSGCSGIIGFGNIGLSCSGVASVAAACYQTQHHDASSRANTLFIFFPPVNLFLSKRFATEQNIT